MNKELIYKIIAEMESKMSKETYDFAHKKDWGIRSTQVVALLDYLIEAGIIKPKDTNK